LKIINPGVGSRERTAAETIVEVLAMMLAKERLKNEIDRKRAERRVRTPKGFPDRARVRPALAARRKRRSVRR
jgi:hypothetical protein